MLYRFFHTLISLSLLFVCCSKAPRITQELPNILLIVLDAARADHFSCYGYHRPTTPNIDRVAAEGLRFTRAVSSSSWTLPSHASLFTGLLPDEHGTHSRHAWLIDRFPTLAELLKDKGYRTAAFSNNPFVSSSQNLNQGFDVFEAIYSDTTVITDRKPHNTEHTNKLVNSFINEVGGQPFFIFINYMDIHMPYDPPEPYRSMYLDPGVEITTRIDSGCKYADLLIDSTIVLNEKEEKAVVDIYDGCFNYLDAKVGELFGDLREKGIYDKTLIIITSDHGEVFGEYGYYGHGGVLYRPLIHIPLVIRHPWIIPSPGVRETLVSINDIFHTLVELLGVNGASPTGALVRNLFETEIVLGPCYSQLFLGRSGIVAMIRNHDTRSVWIPEDMHYIYCEEEIFECFDLNTDFAEEHNLCPDIVSREEVVEAIMDVRESLIEFTEGPEDLRVTHRLKADPQQERAMRALGYVGGNQAQERNVVEEHPHVMEHIKTGMFFFKKNWLEEAEKEIRTALSMSPRNPVARKYLGMIFMRKGEYADAIRVLRSVVEVFQNKIKNESS